MALRRSGKGLVTNDINALRAALRKEADVLMPAYVKEVTAQLVYKVYYGIVLSTPVFTGRARVNWMVTLGSPSTRAIDAEQKIREEAHWFSVTGQPLSSVERDTINAAMEAVRRGAIGRKVFLTNNMPYISFLEDGKGSAKAPSGMVSITLDWVQELPQRDAIHRAALSKLRAA